MTSSTDRLTDRAVGQRLRIARQVARLKQAVGAVRHLGEGGHRAAGARERARLHSARADGDRGCPRTDPSEPAAGGRDGLARVWRPEWRSPGRGAPREHRDREVFARAALVRYPEAGWTSHLANRTKGPMRDWINQHDVA